MEQLWLLMPCLAVFGDAIFARRSKRIAFAINIIALALFAKFYVLNNLGGEVFLEFSRVYFIEILLSLDNVFIFLLIIKECGIHGSRRQDIVLNIGILLAIGIRVLCIKYGLGLVHLPYIMEALGLMLVVTGFMQFRQDEASKQKSFVLKIISKINSNTGLNKRNSLIPLVVCAIMLAFVDMLFALDSIPASLSVAQRTESIMYANIFAVIGMKTMFLTMKGLLEKFKYLESGISAILVFIGCKLFVSGYYTISTNFSFAFIAFILTASIVLSRWRSVLFAKI